MYGGQFLKPLAISRAADDVSLIQTVRTGSAQDVQSFFLWRGGNPDVQDRYGKSSVHYACERGNAKIVRVLIIGREANVHIQDNTEKTPLHYAAAGGHTQVCLLLLEQGALLYLLDSDGNTAVDLARDNGHDTLAETLHVAQQNQLAVLQSAFKRLVSSDIADVISEFAGHRWQHAPATVTPIQKPATKKCSPCSWFFCCR